MGLVEWSAFTAFILDVCVAVIATKKGRSAIGWFFISIFVTPILSFIMLMVMGETTDFKLAELRKNKQYATGEAIPDPYTHMKCPDCAELIKIEAKVCKHCGCRIAHNSAQQTIAPDSAA
jgi:hypothetical protein